MRLSFLDWWAAIAAAVAFLALVARANMLKPEVGKWVSAPKAVFLALAALGAFMGAVVISIVTTDGATPREAANLTAQAVVSAVMLINLTRQKTTT